MKQQVILKLASLFDSLQPYTVLLLTNKMTKISMPSVYLNMLAFLSRISRQSKPSDLFLLFGYNIHGHQHIEGIIHSSSNILVVNGLQWITRSDTHGSYINQVQSHICKVNTPHTPLKLWKILTACTIWTNLTCWTSFFIFCEFFYEFVSNLHTWVMMHRKTE